MRKLLISSAMLLALSACSGNAQVTYSEVVTTVQTGYPIVKALIAQSAAKGTISTAAYAKITALETSKLDAEIAALSSLTMPTTGVTAAQNLNTALADIGILVDAAPSSDLKTQVSSALATAQVAVGLFEASQGIKPTTHSAETLN